MSHQLKHIFDSSACLTKRQLKDYASGVMSQEEQYAVEHHVTTCFFCSEALDGMMQQKGEALVTVDELNTNFLKDHFSLTNPQIHLNSLAPSVQAQPIQRVAKKRTGIPLLKPSSIAAALILGFGVLWYLEHDKNDIRPTGRIAQVSPASSGATASPDASKSAMAAPDETGTATRPVAANAAQNESANMPGNQPDQPQRPQALVATNPETGKNQADASKELKTEAATPSGKDTESNPLAKTEAAEETVKPATKSTAAMTFAAPVNDNAASGARSNANTYVIENSKIPASKKVSSEASTVETADDLYASGNYRAALNVYRKQMNAAGAKDEQHAALQAAHCYINLGQKESAIKLLQSLAENGSGSAKRQAKRLLKEMDKEKAE